MPVIRLLLVASLLLSQVGCRSLSSQAPQVTHGVFPVPVVSSSDLTATFTTEVEALYQLTKTRTEDVKEPVSYSRGTRPAGTVLGFERTPEGLFAICGPHRIPIESTAHSWELLRPETRISPNLPQQTLGEVSRAWFGRVAEQSSSLASCAVLLLYTVGPGVLYLIAAGNSQRGSGSWYR